MGNPGPELVLSMGTPDVGRGLRKGSESKGFKIGFLRNNLEQDPSVAIRFTLNNLPLINHNGKSPA